MVGTPKGYTKHYYAGTERIATVIGGGGLYDMEFPIDHNMTQHEKKVIDAFYNQYQTSDPFLYEKLLSGPEKTEDILGKQNSDLDYQCKSVYLDYVNVLTKTDILFEAIDKNTKVNSKEDEVYFYHGDHLGSANWITDGNSKPIQYIHYAPYGELIANQRAVSYDERYKFTGKERDRESGYDYFGARYYASALSHWLSVDPLAEKYPNISPYAYCGWNPVKFIDKDGRDVYMFDEDGTFVTKQVKEGTHYGMVFMDDKSNYSFEFADPINDPQAIDDGNINKVLFVTDDQISQILKESGVTEDKNRQNRYSYVYIVKATQVIFKEMDIWIM